MGTQHSVLPVILDLRIKARELKRQSDRCYRESLQEREKIRRALLRHNQEGARPKPQLPEEDDAAPLRAPLCAIFQLTTKIHSVASGLSGALRKLDSSASLREIELFSKLFDDLDVRSDSVSSLLDASTSSAMPTQQVDKVLLEVAQAYRIPLEDHAEAADALVATHKEQMSRQQETGVHEGEKEAHEEPFVIINAAYEMLRNETHRKLFDRRGSGDGGRFVRRGHNTGILGRTAAAATTVLDMMNLFAQGYSFGEEEDTPVGQSDSGFAFEWDLFDMASII
ncbi:charged multivesicular body protein [Cyclospora cayetanensis]|uniref:Charged multivesicular body protein n=1 Tax=Cyclospora cayetanensis TaxID=88456 RepID=A0A1D3D9X5_9EIME|nr:charged multivesicular body protein [Cyclospora cayetanensis]